MHTHVQYAWLFCTYVCSATALTASWPCHAHSVISMGEHLFNAKVCQVLGSSWILVCVRLMYGMPIYTPLLYKLRMMIGFIMYCGPLVVYSLYMWLHEGSPAKYAYVCMYMYTYDRYTVIQHVYTVWLHIHCCTYYTYMPMIRVQVTSHVYCIHVYMQSSWAIICKSHYLTTAICWHYGA